MQANPFAQSDAKRHALWDMLVRRDIEAFAARDWEAHRRDFAEAEFHCLDAKFSADSRDWVLAFPDLATYGAQWLAEARRAAGRIAPAALIRAHRAASSLDRIDIAGDRAACHKHFDGEVVYADGEIERLNWRTIYFCRKVSESWKITGFVGYLPNS